MQLLHFSAVMLFFASRFTVSVRSGRRTHGVQLYICFVFLGVGAALIWSLLLHAVDIGVQTLACRQHPCTKLPKQVHLSKPLKADMFTCISVAFRDRDTRVQTVVLRGSTPCVLDEAEKAVDDACAFAKALTKDRRFVAGAGAAEMEVARKLQVCLYSWLFYG